MSITHADVELAQRAAQLYLKGTNPVDAGDVVSDAVLALEDGVRDWETSPDLRNRFARNEFLVGRCKRRIVDGFRLRDGRNGQKGGFERGMLRLDDGVSSAMSNNRGTWSDVIGADDPGYDEVESQDLLAELSEREQYIVSRTVLEGWTEPEVAAEFGVTASRISQVRKRAFARLRGEQLPESKMLVRRETELTEREIEIVQCVAEGLTNAEIGKRLFLSEETIKSHLRHVTMKTEAKSRAQAVAICFRAGLLR